MRYSRIRKGKNQKRYAVALIVILLIFAGAYFFSAGSLGKYISNLISPILKSRQDVDTKEPEGTPNGNMESGDTGTELTLPEDKNQEDQNDQSPRITETISVDVMNFFGIQMGAFNDKQNAQSVADQLKTKGGAGYTVDDQFTRVMAMMFLTEEDAILVKDQLKEQSVEAQIYTLKCPGVEMEITASSEKIEGIKSSFLLIKDKIGLMESIIKELDNDKITTEIAINKVGEIEKELIAKADQLSKYSATQEGNPILSGLKDLLSEQAGNLNQISQENISDKVEISSKIKYNYIDMILKYKGYMEQITKG